MAAKTKADLPGSNTRSRGRQQTPPVVQSPSNRSITKPSTPRNTRARSKSGGGTTDKPAAKQLSSTGEKTSSTAQKTPATHSRKSTTTPASSGVSKGAAPSNEKKSANLSNTSSSTSKTNNEAPITATSRQTRSSSRGKGGTESDTTPGITTPIKVSVKIGGNKEATPIKMTGVSSGSEESKAS